LELVAGGLKCDLGARGERTGRRERDAGKGFKGEGAVGGWTGDDETGGEGVNFVKGERCVERRWEGCLCFGCADVGVVSSFDC
jgi:hypothetical protein